MKAPSSNIDLFSDATILNPYPRYRELRDMGPVVWLERHGVFAIGRYENVRACLQDWENFSSAQGVTFNDPVNNSAQGTMLASDPPAHDELRRMIAPPLFPKALRDSAPLIAAEAEALVDRLVEQREFDGVIDLAWHLPTTVVTKLVGLPQKGRERMRLWGLSGFNVGGPLDNPHTQAALGNAMDMVRYVRDPTLLDRLTPGSWAARLIALTTESGIPPQQAATLLIDYVAPSLDTTVSATASTLWYLARDPAVWAEVRANPALIPQAALEAIRLETPIRLFTRVTTADVEIDGVSVPQGARVALLYGSANRDERKWPDPDQFNLHRKPIDHVGFGHGVHICVGMHLAQLEIRSVLGALVQRVERIEVGEPELMLSNQLRSFQSLPMKVR